MTTSIIATTIEEFELLKHIDYDSLTLIRSIRLYSSLDTSLD